MLSVFHRLFNNGKHKHRIDYIAEVNSGVSAFALFPQLLAVFNGQATTGLSSLSFFLITMNSVVWFIYGVHRRIPPLIISSSLNATASVGILYMIVTRS